MADVTVSNVSYLMGANKTEALVVEGSVAAVIAKGELLSYNKLTGYYKVWPGGVESIDAICGISTIIPAAGYVETVCSVFGLYNSAGFTVPAGVDMDVVEKSSDTAMAIAVVAGNTGDGAPGAIVQGDLAKAGTYDLICTDEASNAGTFQVTDPNGAVLPSLTVAVAYDNGHFAFTLADGTEDFDIGDAFTVIGQVNADGTPRMLMTAKGMRSDTVVQMNS